MNQPLSVLIVEDNPDDAELVVRELRRAGFEPKWKRVETEEAFLSELRPAPDIILSDYEMPVFSGRRALELARDHGADIPFIIISGTIGEDVAVEVMRQGATDYLLKDRLARLGISVVHAMEQGRLRREQALAAEALRQSERELRWKTAFLEAQVDAAIDGILVVDEQGHKLLQNHRMLEIFKIPVGIANLKDDSEQLRWVTGVVADPDAFIQRVNHLYAHPEEAGRDEVVLKDGTVLDRYSAAVRGVDGRYYGRIWTFRDITERKLAEAALRDSEERFREIAENIQEVFWITDPASGRTLYVSPAYEVIWGRSRESLCATPGAWLETIHPDDRERVRLAAATRQTQGTYDEEYRVVRPDGSVRWIRDRAFPVQDAAGHVPRVVGVARDISGQKLAEEKLGEQASLLDKARDAIVVRHLEHGITYWNKSAEDLYGWKAREVLGRAEPVIIYRHAQDHEQALKSVVQAGEWQGELQQIDRAGNTLLIAARWTLVRDRAGNPESILEINTDITEQKKIEEQFFRAQRMESIGTLASGIAHDLNNVLTPILMSIELLRMTCREARAQSLLATIEDSSKRGADMVRQILSFARGVEGERALIDPRLIIEEMQKLVHDTFPKNILFHPELPPSLPAFLGDRTQVHQVLLNLCVNARDAMPQGGTLTVSASTILLDDHYAAMHEKVEPGTYVRLRVADTGTGMTREVMEKIFDPFFTTKELGKGTGLGLATVLSIVKSHGGFLDVESEPGAGTTFTLGFPVCSQKGEGVPMQDEKLHPRGDGEVVLVVDDEAAVRFITQQTLESYGYKVLLAADGAEAAARFAQSLESISVVLLDMMMPVMDGPSTIQVLRRMSPRVKIIAASGLSAMGEAARAAGLGISDFLPKPYNARDVLLMLQRVLKTEG